MLSGLQVLIEFRNGHVQDWTIFDATGSLVRETVRWDKVMSDTWDTLMNLAMIAALCFAVVLDKTISCTHCVKPLKSITDLSRRVLPFMDPVLV